MGLGLWIKATLLQDANDIPRHVVFTLTKGTGHIVLDDVIQVVVAEPSKCLLLAVSRDRRMNNHLTRYGYTVHIKTLHAHLIHKCRDVLC